MHYIKIFSLLVYDVICEWGTHSAGMSMHHIQEERAPHAPHCKKPQTHMICKHSDSVMITTGTGMSVLKTESPYQYL